MAARTALWAVILGLGCTEGACSAPAPGDSVTRVPDPGTEIHCLAPRFAEDLESSARDVSILREIDVSKLSIPEALPGDSLIARSIYSGAGVVTGHVCPPGVADALCDEEAARTAYWIRRLSFAQPTLRPAHNSRVFLVPNMQGEDDGAFTAYRRDGTYVEIVDGRIMTLLVHGPMIVYQDGVDLLRQLVNIPCALHVTKTMESGSSCSWGVIECSEDVPNWFARPVEWLRIDDTVVFAFEKLDNLPPCKLVICDTESWRIAGGIPYSDPRPFKRFAGRNRLELEQEYADSIRRAALESGPRTCQPALPGPLHNQYLHRQPQCTAE